MPNNPFSIVLYLTKLSICQRGDYNPVEFGIPLESLIEILIYSGNNPVEIQGMSSELASFFTVIKMDMFSLI